MNILTSYLHSVKKSIIFSVLLGLSASACQTLLVVLISKLETSAHNYRNITDVKFNTLILIFFVTNLIFSILIARVSQFSSYKIQEILSKKITELPLKVIETLGYHKLQAALTQDTLTIANFIALVPNLIAYSVVVVACLIYLLSLSVIIFSIASILLISIMLCFIMLDKYYINPKLIAAREIVNGLYNNFNGLLIGAKELKLDKNYRLSFIKNLLLKNAHDYYKNNFNAMTAFSLWQTMWQALLFILIGSILFHSNSQNTILQQSITVILFISAPVVSLINSLPSLRRSAISLAKMQELDHDIHECNLQEYKGNLEKLSDVMDSLALKGIKYTYKTDGGNFELGPINMEIRSSQVTFIVGKNGSGKSTLVKILSGLYEPSNGQLILNKIPITQYNLSWYREHVSVLFYNFYLFDDFIVQEDQLANIINFAKCLNIEEFVNFQDKSFSKLQASDGLRRRLALLNMIIQNKPILILDEPTSDQDAEFKEYFYKYLIPILKQDRFLIIISHDPNYYFLADEIVFLEDGKVTNKAYHKIFNCTN
jgi:putative ATP-binding cassette transporter